jgi:hypothetical protein
MTGVEPDVMEDGVHEAPKHRAFASRLLVSATNSAYGLGLHPREKLARADVGTLSREHLARRL